MKKILIVEDDSQLSRAYEQKFSGNYSVTIVDDGAAAVAKARELVPDLILLDIMLPGEMNGLEVLQKMRETSELASIPVIVLTNLDNQKEEALALGATAYYVKADSDLKSLSGLVDNIIGT